jgi:hypothetical protein
VAQGDFLAFNENLKHVPSKFIPGGMKIIQIPGGDQFVIC